MDRTRLEPGCLMPTGRPLLLAYDGSEPSRNAIERAAELMATGPAIVLTVWESAVAVVFRHELPGSFGVARDVIEELDGKTEEGALKVASEGAELARSSGFEPEALAKRAFDNTGREETTVWQEILRTAEERDVAAVVLGSRGLSRVGSVLLGSVSYGIVHHSRRPVLVVPAGED